MAGNIVSEIDLPGVYGLAPGRILRPMLHRTLSKRTLTLRVRGG